MSAREIGESLRNLRSVASVDTPKGKVYVRGMTGRERAEYLAELRATDQADLALAEHRLVANCWTDSDGAKVYENGQAFEIVLDWDPELVKELGALVLKKSGLSKESQDAAEKN